MSVFKRLFKIGQAEAHNIVDKLEDPIKLTEQGIRDLKRDLDQSLKALAEVKAMSIKAKKESAEARNRAKSYENKAMMLLTKVEKGELDSAEADRLATEALNKKQDAENQASSAQQNAAGIDKNLVNLEQNVKKLRSKISHYENELKTLKARAKVSQATTKLNKQMAQIDSTGTIAMLEKMKEKVTENEALSEAYADVANENRSIDEEIDDVLGTESPSESSDALAALKAKMKAGKGEE
ncbi:MAG: PspA/IM30 family protein [Cytophagales bacterium]|nr:PspA/IM30 family protein [Cytophagales bacterium]